MAEAATIVSWLHVGDPHITRAGEENHRDLLRIVALSKSLAPGSIDFALLPGDSADDGTAEQFAIVRDAVAGIPFPLHILPGDHDFKPRTLDAFHAVLGAEELPKAAIAGNYRCLFLDVVSAGGGGLDFRLGDAQLAWTERQLDKAAAAEQDVAVFMHTYPADLRDCGEQLASLLAQPHVLCVAMGHTHYNELANDDGTIYMATRSTGQIEEGPAGLSFAAIDGGVVSWRFVPLGGCLPLVLVTSPADHRLIIDADSPDQVVRGPVRIAAKIYGMPEGGRAWASVDDGAAFALTEDDRSAALWCARYAGQLEDGLHDLTVYVAGAGGEGAGETIRFLVSHDGSANQLSEAADGSDRDSIEVWPEKHIFGTQLGPNRNGRKW